MMRWILCLIDEFLDWTRDYIYENNFSLLRRDMIGGPVISIFTWAWIDFQFEVVKLIGTIVGSFLAVGIGVIAPMVYRYWMHRLKDRFPFLKELLKHDKKTEVEGIKEEE